MRKIGMMLVALFLSVTLVGCGESAPPATGKTEATTSKSTGTVTTTTEKKTEVTTSTTTAK